MCHLYPYKYVKLLWKFFTLICAVLLVKKIVNWTPRDPHLTIADDAAKW